MSQPEIKRQPDFRYVPADAITFSMTDNGVKLIFGVEESPGVHLQQIGVFMSLATLRLLAMMGDLALEKYEATTGIKVELPADKITELRKSLSVDATAPSHATGDEQRP